MRKNKLLLLLALLLTAATGAWAQETQTWDSGDCTVTISDDVMTVSGAGATADYKDYNLTPWYGYDIKSIVIESGVTSIGNYAFGRFYNLESVSIPASVTSIGTLAFQECGYEAAALTVSIAEGSTPLTIGEQAFTYANLKSIDIPNRVTSIGKNAFSGCSKLESVSIPASVTSIGNFAFENCGSDADALTVSIAEGSTPLTIGNNVFYESNLTSIDIPNRVTSIGNSAFSGCNNLESVSIPASVTSISEGAFSYCGKLAKVYIYAPSLTTYGLMAFQENAAGRKIYVPADAVDTYKAGWPDYATDIEAMNLYATSMKEGTQDADKWTITPNPAAAGQTVTLQYNGRLKVKGVKATSDEQEAVLKAPATVTTAPTGAAIVGVGKTTALVSGGVAEGGTLMYAVTTENTKPTSTDGFSDAVPTAQTITASGKVYVWYYVKGDDTHSDSEIAATAIEVPVADIIWDATNISNIDVAGNESYEKEGVRLSANAAELYAYWDNDGIKFEVYESGGYTFTAPAGKAFTKIEMNAVRFDGWESASFGKGWAYSEDDTNHIYKVTWTGSAASTVGLLRAAEEFEGANVKSIAFYLSE